MNYIKEPTATRHLGEAYIELMGRHSNLWVLNADLPGSLDVVRVRQRYPDRVVEVGIAEQNMASIAYGLALAGKTVIVNTFAKFMARALDQIHQAGRSGNKTIIYRATHAGIGVGEDGESAQAIGDLGEMSSNAGVDIVVDPVDINEASALLRELIEDRKGTAYMRTYRQKLPVVLPGGYKAGVGRGYAFSDDSDADIMVVASGSMVEQALDAQRRLKEEFIGINVAAFSTIKPRPSAEQIKPLVGTSRLVVTAEDHLIAGGLGDALSDALTRLEIHHRRVGLHGYGETGKPAELYRKRRLDGEGIASQVKEFAAELHL